MKQVVIGFAIVAYILLVVFGVQGLFEAMGWT